MSLPAKTYITPEEYLAMEERAETKSEYYNGEIFAMAGASPDHSVISINLAREISFQFKGKSCTTYSSDTRVKISETGLYVYPDLTVACGEARFEEGPSKTLLNPTLIIEILSPSTEAYDRGMKSAHYRKLESLTDYMLVSQDAPHVEHFSRQEGNRWILSEADGLDSTVHLPSIDCNLLMAEIYDRVGLDGSGLEGEPI